MLRRSLFLIPVAAAAAALVGVALRDVPVAAAIAGAAIGLAVAAALSAVIDRRLLDIVERIRRFSRGAAPEENLGGSRAWRQLAAELADVGTTLRRRYDDLAAERARVERLLDALPTAILLFEPGRLGYANPAARDLFGVAREEARSPFQVLGVEALADAVAEVRATGRSLSLDVDREDRHLSAHATATGEDVVALIVTDLTDARRLEDIRRDFVTNASHELKTPVAGMQALADSLRLAVDRDSGRARSMITRLETEAARLAKLVRELLDLARLEEDAAAQSGRRRVDFTEIVRSQIDSISPDASKRGVKVVLQADDPATVVAQPQDLRLIAANLLENAVRYNRPGGHVDVRVRRDAATVVFEVEDNGIGIPEADRDRVFERFYRVDRARSRAAGGTGLGLSIVRHAAERHGGEVSMRSVLGEGSSFQVVLPVDGLRPTRR